MFVVNAARAVLKIVNLLNWLAQCVFAVVLVALVTGLATPSTFGGILAGHDIPSAALPGHEAAYLHLIELVLVIGFALATGVHIVCTRAIAIIDTLKAGDPFVRVNAKRLTEIGWALLALQFIYLAYAWLSHELEIATGRHAGWDPAFNGWLTVLLVFVLARVFAHGTELQDEVEGTV